MRELVLVKWLDIVVRAGWQAEADLPESCVCTSVGFIFKRTEKDLILAADLSDNEGNRLIAIPRGCILSVSPLPTIDES